MAQSRNNPVGETEREEEQREREGGSGSKGNSLSARSLLLSMELRYLLHMCVGTSDKSTHPLPTILPVALLHLPDFITYLPRPFLPTGAALRSNETKSHKWPQCFLACYSPLAPPPPCTPSVPRQDSTPLSQM